MESYLSESIQVTSEKRLLSVVLQVYVKATANQNMGEPEQPDGPDPSSLEAVNHTPKGVMPLTLRVTYSSNSPTDYANLRRSAGQVIIELADPLFGLIRKAGEVSDFLNELNTALTTIGLGSIVSHFRSTIAEYVNTLLHVDAFPKTIALSTVAYLLKKMYDAELLMLGYIHQASIDELPNWLGLIENAKSNPDISVT
ncbi:hypothetical protein [Haloferax sp. DFSO52]|uniref:hypothetical protein n=1 Tax=Haloferax sp. DFSO52 TaxID=3388505 RepID=UPI003A89AF4A